MNNYNVGLQYVSLLIYLSCHSTSKAKHHLSLSQTTATPRHYL